nr:MAG TPA: hypothetical protein [Bacteriophage sp.]
MQRHRWAKRSKGVEQIRAEEQRQSKVFLNERRFYSE